MNAYLWTGGGSGEATAFYGCCSMSITVYALCVCGSLIKGQIFREIASIYQRWVIGSFDCDTVLHVIHGFLC